VADRPRAVTAGRRESDAGASAPVRMMRRKRLIHRSSIRIVARLIDVTALYAVTLSLAYSAGLDVWGLPVLFVLPLFLLPAAVVAGVWIVVAYRFRYAEAVAGHLLHAVAGAALGLCAIIVLALLICISVACDAGQYLRRQRAGACVAGTPTIGIVRAATRRAPVG